MAFTGAWRTRALGYTDETAPLGAAEPERHMTDFSYETHGTDDTAETRGTVTTPYRLDYGPAELVDSTDTTSGKAVAGPNVPLDHESRDHGLNDDLSSGQYRGAGRRVWQSVQPSLLHMRDNNSIQAREYDTPFERQYDQVDSTVRFTPNHNENGSRMALLRGANAYAENNPYDTSQHTQGLPNAATAPRVGWTGERRPGMRVQRWSERKIPMHRPVHSSRAFGWHVAKTAQDAPALAAGEGNQYSTPYAALANMRQRIASTPMQRRDPRMWDDSAVTDGTDETEGPQNETFNVWGL